MTRHGVRLALGALALVASAGCTLFTASDDALRVYYTPRDLGPPGEVDWPTRPSVFGGATVIVRGAMVSPCGAVVSRAERAGTTVTIRITSVDDSRACPAAQNLQPFEAELIGLRPGTWDIHLDITSVAEVRPTRVAITPP